MYPSWRTHSCVQRSHSLENTARVVDFADARCRGGLHPAADLQSALAVAWFLPLETARRADCRSCERVFVAYATVGSNLKWCLGEIFAALERGAVLLTATRRLARVFRIEFTSWQRDHGRTVWKSPLILPLDAYVRRLWDNWLAQGPTDWGSVLLSARQGAAPLGHN